MKAEEFDLLFDEGLDIDAQVDWTSARRPNLELQKLQLELPGGLISALDDHAKAAGVERATLIERWLTERLLQDEHAPVAAE